MSASVPNRHDGGGVETDPWASDVRVVGLHRCSRSALLGGTALRAAALVVLATPANAQLAAGAHPTGGVVVGGSASITQSGATTDITQKSGRTAIDWQSFNVGSSAKVVFTQPSSSSVALNTVVGPNPSEIAGRITANGVVAIVNQSGVIFDQGSQVDTAGLVVSAAGITRQNFMSGHMVFNQAAHPGARVVNNGAITIQQAGLAALVAPQVVNNGVITAKLGRVILGGAATYTLDLYGDGLLALNVTGQVTQVTLGGRTMPALVTNAGTILADGGTVVLNAVAADGLIRTLVEAGGSISASSVGSQAGRVLVQGIGGSVDIEGGVSATGVAPGTRGGTIVANATGTVSLASTARIDASGASGGGLVAVGTTAARAASRSAHATLTARAVTVAAGATLAASATGAGNGGEVTLLSTGTTSLGGAISVLGGPAGGNGGFAEISGEKVALTGIVNSSAPLGRIGSMLIDPAAVVVADVSPPNLGTFSFLKDTTLSASTTGITITASGDIAFAYDPAAGAKNTVSNSAAGKVFSVTSNGGNINVDAGFTLTSVGSFTVTADKVLAFDSNTGKNIFGFASVSSSASVLAGPVVSLTGTTGVQMGGASITGSTSLDLTAASGAISGGVITTPSLTATASTGINLSGSNAITATGAIDDTASGDITIDNAGALLIGGALTSAGNVTLSTGALTINGTIATAATGTASITVNAGGLTEESVTTPGSFSGAIHAQTLTGRVAAGSADLRGSNVFGTLGAFSTGGASSLLFAFDSGAVDVAGVVSAGGALALDSLGTGSKITVAATGSLAAGGGANLQLGADSFALTGGVTNTGIVTFGRASSGALNLGGTADSFGGLGVAAVSAGTLVLGSVSGDTADTNTTSLGISQSLGSSALTLALYSSGGITEAGLSVITAKLLEGSASGDVSLGGANEVTTLGGFTTSRGSLAFTNAQSLLTTGSQSASSGLSLTVTGLGHTLGLGGTLSGASVTLTSPAAINQTAGKISTTDLFAVSTTGSIGLGQPANAFATITTMDAAGAVTLNDGEGFALAGPVNGTAVSLTSAGTISQGSGGVITATSLTGSAAADVSLTATNDIGTLGAFTTASGGFALIDGGSLTVNGLVHADVGGTVASPLLIEAPTLTVTGSGSLLYTGGVISLGADTLTLTGDVTTGAAGLVGIDRLTDGTLSLGAAGLPTVSTGTLSIGSLDGTTTGHLTAIHITGALSVPDTLDLFTSGSLTAVAGLSAGTLTGHVGSAAFAGTDSIGTLKNFGVDGGGLALTDSGSLIIAGTVVATGAAISLDASGDITERTSGVLSGALTATSLTGSASGSIDLGDGANDIGTVTGLVATGGPLVLADSSPLHVDGVVTSGAGLTLSVTGSGNALALDAAAALTAAGTLALSAAGALTEDAAATLSATTLTGSAGGSVALIGSNLVGTLGPLSAGAGLTLDDGESLTATGSVSAVGALAITVSTGTLSIGTSSAGDGITGASVALESAGKLTQFAGGSITGTAGTIGLTSDTGNIAFGGTLSAASGAVQFAALSGTVTETDGTTAGAINAASTTGTAKSITLTGLNAVATLTNLDATSGKLTIDEAPASASPTVAVTGVLSATSTLAITLAGSASVLSLGGVLDAPTVALTAPAGIAQPSGGITATTLTAAASGGAVALTAASNQVITLGASSAAGNFGFTDSGTTGGAYHGTLTETGPVTAGSLSTLALRAPTLTVTGSLSAPGGTIALGTDLLSLTGDVTTNAGTGVVGIDTFSGSTLTIGASDFANISTGILALGSLNGIAASGHVTDIEITSGLLALGSNAPTLGLFTTATGTVNATSGISVSTLIGNAGTVSITGANSVTTLGDFTAAGGLIFSQSGNLDVSGAVKGGPSASLSLTATGSTLTLDGSATSSATTLSAGNLQIPGTATGTTTLVLIATNGTITEAGTLNTALLTGSAFGTAALTGSNSVTSLGAFAANGFTLADGQNLSVTGLVDGGAGGIDLITGGAGTNLDISGSLTTSAAVTLSAGGTIGEAGGGITADTLTGSAGSSADLSGTNDIGTLSAFSATSLTLHDGAFLSVAGPVTSPVTSLQADRIDVTGSIDAATSLALTATAGRITEEGSITTGSLTGSSGSFAAGFTGTNEVTDLGDFVASGFNFDQTAALNVTGNVQAGPSATFSIGGSLGIASAGTIGATSVGLTAASIASTGAIDATTLTGVITGDASLTGANTLTNLGDFSATTLEFHNSTGLTLVGSIDAPTSVDLTAAGTISQSGGGITTTLLAASGTGAIDLESAGNVVGTLGAVSVTPVGNTGGLTFAQPGALTVAGPVDGGLSTSITSSAGLLSVTGSVTGSSTSLGGTSIAISGSVTGSQSLALTATDGITESGALTAGTLTGSAGGSADLGGSNSVGTLGNFTADGFTLADGQNLSVTGLVTGGAGDIVLNTSGAANLDISGSLTTSAAMTLSAGGTIGEAGGGLSADTLTGSAGTTADLSGTNDVGTLGNFTAAALILHDGSPLSVAGTVTSPATTIQANEIDVTGVIDAATSLALTSTAGRITEEGGITTGILTGSSGTFASGFTGSNTITHLGDFVANGFTFDQVSALTVTGDVQAGSAATLSIGGSLGIASTGTIAAASVGITAASLAESGAISATTLTGTVAGDANLTGANTLTNVGNFSAATVELDNSTGLTLAGSLTGTQSIALTLTAGTLTVADTATVTGSVTTLKAGAIDLAGVIDAASSADLISAGIIDQTAGGITTTLLAASGTGAIDLASASNAVGTLGAVTVTPSGNSGGLVFGQSGGLTVAGPVDGGLSTSITSSSGLLGVTGSVTGSTTSLSGTSIAISGSATGTQSLALTTSGGITETGSIIAGTLTGSAGTSANLSGANTIGDLGGFTAASLTLLDAGAPTLTTIGAVTITGALSLTAPALSLGGDVNAGSAFLSATGGTIAGAIGVSGSLTGTSTGSTDLTGEVASLGSFTAAAFTLDDSEGLSVVGPVNGGPSLSIHSAGALTLGGPVDATNVSLTGLSIAISATGSVSASGLILSAFGDTTAGDGTIVENAAGGITAGVLSGSAQGSASLVGVNSITTLTAFSAAPLTLHDASALTIGSVTGSYTPSGGSSVFGSVALDLPGQALKITGTLNASGETVSIAAGSVAETGSIIAASLSGTTSGATNLTSASNSISALGSYTASGFTLDDAVSRLTVTGPVDGGASASIANTGSLLVSGTVTSLSTTLQAGSVLTITGTIGDAALFTQASVVDLLAGSVTETGSIIAATLIGNVQGAASLTGNNSITTLGSFTATGGLTLNDLTSLTILGPLSTGPLLSISTPSPLTIGSATGSGTVLSGTTIELSAGNITIDGIINATTSLSLTATDAAAAGTISEIATTALQTPLLTLTAPGAVSLLGADNLIGSTGAVTVGNLQLVDAEDLDVTGALASSNGATITDAGHTVTVSGSIAATDTNLAAGDIAVPGLIDTGTLELAASASGTASGTISAPGTIIAAGVSGSATGSASLVSATDSNQIQSLGGFGAAGFALNDGIALSVTGTVNGGGGTSITADGLLAVSGTVAGSSTTLTGDGIALTGTLTAADLALFSGDSITGSGSASITATSLTGSAAAAVLLTGTNTITTLGSFTATGFSLSDTSVLAIGGPLQGGPTVAIDDALDLTIAGSVAGSSTSLTATSLTVPGTITATTLALSIGGTLNETGIIDTTLLEGSVTGSAAFLGTNTIGTLGAFTAGGLTFVDTTDIVIAGPVTSGATTLTAADIDIPGTLTVSDLVVSTPGTIAEGGTLTVTGTLSGSAGGSAAFTGSNSNSIAAIAGFMSAGLTLDDQQALVVGAVDGGPSVAITDAGLVTVQGSLTGAATALTAAALDVPGTITAAGSLALSIGGTIGEGGSINTPLLTGSATGSAVFSGSNAIDAIGPFTAAGLVVNDMPDLAVVGPVDGQASVAITDQGSLTIGSSLNGVSTSLTAAAIDIPGSVSATTLALTATTGGITEAGSIAAGTLTGTAAAGASFTGSNSIGTLGHFTAAAGLTLDDTPDLAVTGDVSGGPSVTITDAGVLTVSGSITGSATALTGSSIAIIDPPQAAGSVTAADSLVLTATSGSITESGSISTALLSGSATGDADLTGTNAIANLGNFTAANLVLSDAQALSVTGSVSAASIALTTGDLTVTGTLDAPTQIQVTTAGTLYSTGTIISGLLTGSATGGASLIGTDLISTLGSFAASPFVLIDNAALTVTGPVLATASLTITDASGLIISGQITGALTTLTAATIDVPGSIAASTTLSLTASGAITESGSIAAGLLDLSAGGTTTLTGSNAIGTLGNVSAAGLVLDNTIALTVAGTVNGQGSLTLTDDDALTVAGSGSLSGSVMVLNAAGLTVAGAIDAGTSLDIHTPGSIGETGSIATAHLTGSVGGSVDFAGTNQILAVGDFTAAGAFALRDASDLSLDGILNATSGNITLTAADIAQQSGATTGTGILGDTATIGTITLASVGEISLAGLIDAPTILIGDTVLTPAEVVMTGNTIITGSSVPPGTHNPAFPPGNGTRPGIFVLADKFAQTGTTRINPNNRASVIEISLARRNGTVTFDQSYSAGLLAPRSELFLNLNFGIASGHIDVGGLNLSYVLPGSTSLTDLFGTIDNETGPAAAGAAYIKQPNSDYRFNTCPIQSINCILVSPVIVPVTNPVEDVEVTTPRRRRDDDDLIIPNVGEQDF